MSNTGYCYHAFGGLRSGWTDQTEYWFTGQHDDPAMGLYYLRARFYDPATGRFLSKDPFAGIASLPGSQHPYSYALNSPTNFTDPTGEFVFALPAVPYAVTGGIALAGAAYAYLAYHEQLDALRDACISGGSLSPDAEQWLMAATPTDRYKEALNTEHLDAARREAAGEVVARKPDGTPWDHQKEVRNARRGLVRRIREINNRLGYPGGILDAEREALTREFGEASRLLDRSERYLPR